MPELSIQSQWQRNGEDCDDESARARPGASSMHRPTSLMAARGGATEETQGGLGRLLIAYDASRREDLQFDLQDPAATWRFSLTSCHQRTRLFWSSVTAQAWRGRCGGKG